MPTAHIRSPQRSLPQPATAYHSFGMLMQGRNYTGVAGYRWGFGGYESESELARHITYDYGNRIYSPALCRFYSMDPYSGSYNYESPYSYCLSSPIVSKDIDGEWVKIVICKYWRDNFGNLHEKNKISFRRTSHKDIYIKVYNIRVSFEKNMIKESVDNSDKSEDAPLRITIRRDLTDVEKAQTINLIKSELESKYNPGYLEISNSNPKRIRSVNVSFQVVSISENTGNERSNLLRPPTAFYIGEDIDKNEDLMEYSGLTTARNRHMVDYDRIGKGTVSHELLHGLQWSIKRILSDPLAKRAHNQDGLFENKEDETEINIDNVWKLRQRNAKKHE